jgi:hypothetical protein
MICTSTEVFGEKWRSQTILRGVLPFKMFARWDMKSKLGHNYRKQDKRRVIKYLCYARLLLEFRIQMLVSVLDNHAQQRLTSTKNTDEAREIRKEKKGKSKTQSQC